MRSLIRKVTDLAGLRATVMGLGLNGGGVASARFLAEHGALVTVTDMKDEATLTDSLAALADLPIRFVLGRHEMEDFSNSDFVIKNPAVSPDSPYILASKHVETDISLFLTFSSSPLIAVTGSKGKSSVSTAIYHVLKAAGRKCYLGGNITVSPLSFLSECTRETPVVLELSSWQLADIKGLGILKPQIAVLTSIMPDHMNRYSSMDEYVADKRLIYKDQDENCFTICNRDDDWGRIFASETKAKVFWYSSKPLNDQPGAWLDDSNPDFGYFSYHGGQRDLELILPPNLLLRGSHQRKNMLSAALACRLFGIESRSIANSISTFTGVEHRLECFAEKDGISWFNDSAATIPQAVEAAMNSFSSPVILITGGTDKNIDFEPFHKTYAKAKKVLLLEGSGTNKLLPILSRYNISYLGPYKDLIQAIDSAIAIAIPGDSIVLSPGCASFGMFLNEFDRGKKFKELALTILH